MAHTKKITFTSWHDPATNQRVKAKTPGAVQRKARTKCYYAVYVDPRTQKQVKEKGFRDKAATLDLARKLERGAERAAVGWPDRAATAKPLANLLDLYAKRLATHKTKGRSNQPQYVADTVARLRRLFDGCKFKAMGDIEGGAVRDWLAAQRHSAT